MFLSSLINSLSSLVIPVHCVRCLHEGHILCAACQNYFRQSPELHPIGAGIRSNAETLRLGSYLPFNNGVSKIILGAKDDGNQLLEQIVIESLVKARSIFPSQLVLVPIPSTRRARRKRGRDFTRFIADAISQRSGDLVIPALLCKKNVSAQKTLNAHARMANMKGAFALRTDLPAHIEKHLYSNEILLVDDVVTTGATMREGLRALTAGGAHCLGVISAAYSLNWSIGHPAH